MHVFEATSVRCQSEKSTYSGLLILDSFYLVFIALDSTRSAQNCEAAFDFDLVTSESNWYGGVFSALFVLR